VPTVRVADLFYLEEIQDSNNGWVEDGYPRTDRVDDDLNVPCPPHTTERRLVNKIDWHVLPYLCIMYLLAFLDRYVTLFFHIFRTLQSAFWLWLTRSSRVNIANANVFGLSAELKLLTGNKYNIALGR
jgi:hypothetical protein